MTNFIEQLNDTAVLAMFRCLSDHCETWEKRLRTQPETLNNPKVFNEGTLAYLKECEKEDAEAIRCIRGFVKELIAEHYTRLKAKKTGGEGL